nr:hypothetical protein [Ureaplasma parvum]
MDWFWFVLFQRIKSLATFSCVKLILLIGFLSTILFFNGISLILATFLLLASIFVSVYLWSGAKIVLSLVLKIAFPSNPMIASMVLYDHLDHQL